MSKDYSDMIEAAYEQSGNSLGWRFLYSPTATLVSARIAFLGLNPGGTGADATQSTYAMAQGSAFRDESWQGYPRGKSPLQKQVLALFDMLNIEPERVLAGNIVPFRSRDWASLVEPEASLQFGKQLWTEVLSTAQPSTVVTMGAKATAAVADLLGVQGMSRHSSGWGNVSLEKGDFDGGTLLGLPHLSRFGIVTRPESIPYLKALIEGVGR